MPFRPRSSILNRGPPQSALELDETVTQTETLERIYSRLPAAAQREALDFLLFLEGRYVSRHPRQHEAMDDRKTQLTERDGLLFIRGSLTGDIDNLLQQERDARIAKK